MTLTSSTAVSRTAAVLPPNTFALSERQLEVRDIMAGDEMHVLIYGGSRCVSGDTVLDGHTRPIRDMAREGKPVWVHTTRGPVLAAPPFKKGEAKLLRFTLASGKSVTVTPDHRFWDGQQWVRAYSLAVGSSVAVRSFACAPLPTSSEPCRAGYGPDEAHSTKTPSNFAGHCLSGRRRYDPQPHSEEVGAPAYRALRSDELARIPPNRSRPSRASQSPLSDSHKGHPSIRDAIHSLDGRASFRRSTSDDFPSSCHADLFSSRVAGQTCEPSHDQRPDGRLSGLPFCPARSFQESSDGDLYRSALSSCESYDTPAIEFYGLEKVTAITETAKQPFYTLHVPNCEQYFANGILHHNSGKTFLILYAIMCRALMAPGSRHLVARLNAIDVRKSILLDTFPKVCKLAFPDIQVTINKTDMVAYLPDGQEIWFSGLDTEDAVEKVLGREYCTIYTNETSQIAYTTILTLRTRLAQAVNRRDGKPLKLKAYYDLNPTGQQHWTYKEFIEGVRPDNPNMKMREGSRVYAMMNPAQNPHLPADYHLLLDEMPLSFQKRFRDGVYMNEVEGSLWPSHLIEMCRVTPGDLPRFIRIVIGVDPSGSDGSGGDSQGIIVAAKAENGHYYVFRDLSARLSPHGWGKIITDAAENYGADCIVAEVNFGGAMVEAVIMNTNPNVRYRPVTASRGKHIRAEPVAALYEKGIVHHVGMFPELEAQMGMMTTQGYKDTGSPDRLDALVWCLTDLAGITPGQGLLDFYMQNAEQIAKAAEATEEAEQAPLVAMIGPPGIGQVMGGDGRLYGLEHDEETGTHLFRVHPDDVNGLLSQFGWRRA